MRFGPNGETIPPLAFGRAGETQAMPAMAFAAAPRMHSGGGAGLKPDKVPATLQKNERVRSRREAAGYGQGQASAPDTSVTIMSRNAESFRQSRTHVAADIACAVSMGRRSMQWHFMRCACPTISAEAGGAGRNEARRLSTWRAATQSENGSWSDSRRRHDAFYGIRKAVIRIAMAHKLRTTQRKSPRHPRKTGHRTLTHQIVPLSRERGWG